MIFFIDQTTGELYAYDQGAEAFVPPHLTPCPARPTVYHEWNSSQAAWELSPAAAAQQAAATAAAHNAPLLAQIAAIEAGTLRALREMALGMQRTGFDSSVASADAEIVALRAQLIK